MQTLSSTLTTAQKSNSRKPYIELRFLSRDGSTARTYKTTDSPNIIQYISQVEAKGPGESISNIEGQFSTIIRLRDKDNTIGTADFEGYRVYINWGLVTTAGNEVPPKPSSPSFVFSKRRISTPQDNTIEFMCLSLWEYVQLTYLNVTAGGIKNYLGDKQAYHLLMDYLAGVEATYSVLDDGGVFGTEIASTAYNIAGEINLLPATSVANDALYIGHVAIFNRVSIDIQNTAAGVSTVVEYYNGTSFVTLNTNNCDYSDGPGFNSGFNVGGLKIFAFQVPSNWATTTVDGETNFYIRIRVTTGAASQPKANRWLVGMHVALALDTNDAAQDEDFQPIFTTKHTDTNAQLAVQVLEYTKLGLVVKQDGFHLKFIDTSDTTQDYTYDTADLQHVIFEGSQTDTTILPNTFIVIDSSANDVAVSSQIEGTANISGSVTAWGTIPAIIEDKGAVTTALADQIAANRLDQKLRERSQGKIFAKVNTGQEVWDIVQTNDARLNNNLDGFVTRIYRLFTAGVYVIQLDLGSYVSSTLTGVEEVIANLLGIPPLPTRPLPPPPIARIIGDLIDEFRNLTEELEIIDPNVFSTLADKVSFLGFLALGGTGLQQAPEVFDLVLSILDPRTGTPVVRATQFEGRFAASLGRLLRQAERVREGATGIINPDTGLFFITQGTAPSVQERRRARFPTQLFGGASGREADEIGTLPSPPSFSPLFNQFSFGFGDDQSGEDPSSFSSPSNSQFGFGFGDELSGEDPSPNINPFGGFGGADPFGGSGGEEEDLEF